MSIMGFSSLVLQKTDGFRGELSSLTLWSTQMHCSLLAASILCPVYFPLLFIQTCSHSSTSDSLLDLSHLCLPAYMVAEMIRS